jgi:hypothetical protein
VKGFSAKRPSGLTNAASDAQSTSIERSEIQLQTKKRRISATADTNHLEQTMNLNPTVLALQAASSTGNAAVTFKVPPVPIRLPSISWAPSAHPMAPARKLPISPSTTSTGAKETPHINTKHASSLTLLPSISSRPFVNLGKRFKPLTVKPSPCQSSEKLLPFYSIHTFLSPIASAAHLNFETPSSLSPLQQITFPPSIAQRRFVGSWAVILSGLSDAERTTCALASRMLRYAGQRQNHTSILSLLSILHSVFILTGNP